MYSCMCSLCRSMLFKLGTKNGTKNAVSDCLSMLNAMVVMVMLIARCVAGEVGSCPDLPGQLGDPLDLDISGLSLTVQPEDLSCKCITGSR